MTAKPHPGSEPDTRWKERSSTGNPSRRRHPESERPRCRPKCRRAAQQPTQHHPANGTRVPTESSDTREQGIPAAPNRSGAQWEPTAPGQAASDSQDRAWFSQPPNWRSSAASRRVGPPAPPETGRERLRSAQIRCPTRLVCFQEHGCPPFPHQRISREDLCGPSKDSLPRSGHNLNA